MNMDRPAVVSSLVAALVVTAGAAAAQLVDLPTYKQPPAAIRRVLDTPPTPGVSMSTDGSHLMLLHRRSLPPVADLSAPMLRLGGSRINPDTNGPHGPIRTIGLTLRSAADGTERAITLPADARVSSPMWSADGSRFVFTNTVTEAAAPGSTAGIELWIGDASTGEARRLVGPMLNASAGSPAQWMPDQKHVLVRLIPEGRGPRPPEPRTPVGPTIQVADGKPAPVRTFQDLLQNPHDEALFDHVMAAQLAIINVDSGARVDVRDPAIYSTLAPSPDGKFLLVSRVERPYSYQIPWSFFPETYEVWSLDEGSRGTNVREIAKVPMRDNIPTQGVETGPRSIQWIDSRDATLLWAEALDGGDPRAKVPHRDRLMVLAMNDAAAATASPRELIKLEHRYRGASWLEDPAGEAPDASDRAMLGEFERERRWSRTWLISLGSDAAMVAEPRLVFDRSVNDRYNDPGSPVFETTPRGENLIKVIGSGASEAVFLTGQGATPEGDRPFLSRMTLADFSREIQWRNEGEKYETVVDVIGDGNANVRVVTSMESKTTPPNLFERRLGQGNETSEVRALTTFTDPLPELRGIKREIVTYTRADGTPLSATMYLPPGYVEGTKLPLFIWAYPNEASDAATAGQVAGSDYRFTQIGGSSQLFLLLAGYAVMSDASMPVIGDPETMNDTFVEQIVSNAQAAINKAVAMGVADTTRVAVGGHSYGAFMTANLLAHAPKGMFRAGVARSGAYNRSLTPFGFQSERRSYWEARDVYTTLSPFTYADQIKTPLLLIHGEIDNNPGTFPIQSERLFQAIRGNGGTARLVILPHESHGYMARESVGHVLAEMVEWLDTHMASEKASEKAGEKASEKAGKPSARAKGDRATP